MRRLPPISILFFFNDTATTEIYTLSLHDALPISTLALIDQRVTTISKVRSNPRVAAVSSTRTKAFSPVVLSPTNRSEEYTSELQSPCNLVCRLLLEKKKQKNINLIHPSYS